ncbi:hypothetical protein Tco_1265306, partial [Tanacetum coccineum]
VLTLILPANFWDEQLNWKIISWKLHSSSGVHTIMTSNGLVIHMLVENRYPLTKEVLSQMLDLKLETEEESTMALELIKFVKQQLEEFEDSNDDDLATSDHEEAERSKRLAGKELSNPFIADDLLKIIVKFIENVKDLMSALPLAHYLWSSSVLWHQQAINGFDVPLPVAICSGLVNPLAPRKGSEKRVEDSTKRAGTKLEQEVANKQKIDDAKIDDDQEEAEMKKLIKVVPDEEEVAMDAIPLATKPLCIILTEKIWKLYGLGEKLSMRVNKARGGYEREDYGINANV